MPKAQRKILGRHIVADQEICLGKPTFVGTRIMVAQVLKQVAKGMSWDAITAEWRGAVTGGSDVGVNWSELSRTFGSITRDAQPVGGWPAPEVQISSRVSSSVYHDGQEFKGLKE